MLRKLLSVVVCVILTGGLLLMGTGCALLDGGMEEAAADNITVPLLMGFKFTGNDALIEQFPELANITVIIEQQHDQAEAGTILATSPEAFKELKRDGGLLILTLSRGPAPNA